MFRRRRQRGPLHQGKGYRYGQSGPLPISRGKSAFKYLQERTRSDRREAAQGWSSRTPSSRRAGCACRTAQSLLPAIISWLQLAEPRFMPLHLDAISRLAVKYNSAADREHGMDMRLPGSRPTGFGQQRCLFSRLPSHISGARTAVHILSVPRHGHLPRTQRLAPRFQCGRRRTTSWRSLLTRFGRARFTRCRL